MDKSAIKRYAVWARRDLIEKVSQKAQQYGIEDGVTLNENVDSINGKLLSDIEKRQRAALVRRIAQEGYSHVIEEVAYTWFNRFVALRFMEVNGYLPSHIRVFSDENNAFKPQIMTEALHLELENIDRDKIISLIDANKNEELFKYLLICQCNSLNDVLPDLFQKIEDYTELLLPDYLLRTSSVLEQLVSAIPEDDWKDQVQIIGWLYQYYNSEPKDQVFADLKNNKKVTKESIPAATQLFTPDWIVRYMVENSLGSCFSNQGSDSWKYLLQERCDADKSINPIEIRCIDPCMGSGHVLVYMFDVLIQIYEERGYSAREAASIILENNIYGLDIDERAAQLASFALMMKARQYDRRIFSKQVRPNVQHFQNLELDKNSFHDEKIRSFIQLFENISTYGSLSRISVNNLDEIKNIVETMELDIFNYEHHDVLKRMVEVVRIISQKYDVVVTNPPYMGAGSMDAILTQFMKKNYADEKTDLFAAFITRCGEMLKPNGVQAMITQHAWMFLPSFEKLRLKLENKTVLSLVHLGAHAFEEIGGEVVQTVAFVVQNNRNPEHSGNYIRLVDYNSQDAKEEAFFEKGNHYTASQNDFKKIPGNVFAYWAGESFLKIFEEKSVKDFGNSCIGMRTGDNNRFLRLWFEVAKDKIGLEYADAETAKESGKKWFPYCKGGSFRKWFGNNYYLVNWENDGYEIKENTKKVYPQLGDNLGWKISNEQFYFKKGLTWSGVGASIFGIRSYPEGMIFDSGANSLFVDDSAYYYYFLGMLNTRLYDEIIKMINPTINTGCGVVASLPAKIDKRYIEEIDEIVKRNIQISKADWDSRELSWDFKKHPMVDGCSDLSQSFDNWYECSVSRFNELKRNEERLNQIFNEIYNVNLSTEVPPENITVEIVSKEEAVKSYISFAVGCMFGRYVIDNYAADDDNIIPICDDEYFEDDIVARFVQFVEVTHGKDSCEKNLQFIADGLGGKGTPREVIRAYFLNDFFNYHCNMCSVAGSGKRPIYWLFDSGKKNGFKCLIYMQRYQQDIIARIRTDYVHEQQARYRTAIEELENRINNVASSEKVKLNKKLNSIKQQEEELHAYEEKIHHLADKMISIDLDDGVKYNYSLFQDVLAKI